MICSKILHLSEGWEDKQKAGKINIFFPAFYNWTQILLPLFH